MVLIVLVLFAATLGAQSGGRACESAPHRAFDFWIGEWEVFTPKNELAGTNRIERILNGCALLENWTSSRGGAGKSLNFYDERLGNWRQVWIDQTGRGQDYTGEAIENGMRFVEEYTKPDGKRYVRRMTFTRIDSDQVRQFIQESDDGGKTFRVWFNGLYKRKK